MSLVKNFCNISRVIKKKTELDYIYSQTTVKERKKEKYHLHADYSQICISSLDLSSELQTHMTICLLDIITWKPVRHLKHIQSRTLNILPSPLSLPTLLQSWVSES